MKEAERWGKGRVVEVVGAGGEPIYRSHRMRSLLCAVNEQSAQHYYSICHLCSAPLPINTVHIVGQQLSVEANDLNHGGCYQSDLHTCRRVERTVSCKELTHTHLTLFYPPNK